MASIRLQCNVSLDFLRTGSSRSHREARRCPTSRPRRCPFGGWPGRPQVCVGAHPTSIVVSFWWLFCPRRCLITRLPCSAAVIDIPPSGFIDAHSPRGSRPCRNQLRRLVLLPRHQGIPSINRRSAWHVLVPALGCHWSPYSFALTPTHALLLDDRPQSSDHGHRVVQRRLLTAPTLPKSPLKSAIAKNQQRVYHQRTRLFMQDIGTIRRPNNL